MCIQEIYTGILNGAKNKIENTLPTYDDLCRNWKDADEVFHIRELASLNAKAFLHRAAIGFLAGYISSKTGIFDEITGLHFGVISEFSMDMVGWAPYNEDAKKYPLFSHNRWKEAVKDDAGAIIGWSLGNIAGHLVSNYIL